MGRGQQVAEHQQVDHFASIFGNKRGLSGKLASQVEAIEQEDTARRWDRDFEDKDYLELAAELAMNNPSPAKAAGGLNFILTSRELWVPTSPRQKRYHGHIALKREADGSYTFVAITTNGGSTSPHAGAKVYATSTSLNSCINALNNQLSEKQSQRKDPYEPYDGGGMVRVSGADFDAAFRSAPRIKK